VSAGSEEAKAGLPALEQPAAPAEPTPVMHFVTDPASLREQ
jgi:hypothetical protein